MQVMTVLGPLNPDKLGITYMHEHVIADNSWSHNDPNKKYDDVDEMVEEMKYFLAAGGKTIVELSTRGLGQNVAALREISQASNVQIVVATGFYRECVMPEYVHQDSIDQIARRMIDDANYGIDGTGIRPGIIGELAMEDRRMNLSPAEEKVLRAGARASMTTGLAISTHSAAEPIALEAIRVMKEEGLQLNRMVMGHMAWSNDKVDWVFQVVDTGVYIGVDAIGYITENYTDRDRAVLVKRLIDRGNLAQITISQDMMRRSFLKCRGGHGYEHLLRNFIPMLKEQGVTDDQIHTMLVDSPRKALCGEAA